MMSSKLGCYSTIIFILVTTSRLTNGDTGNAQQDSRLEQQYSASSNVYTEKLERNYNLQDFLWMSSGDGPAPSEDDGGLAWEDTGAGGPDGHDVVQITTTKTLFKTVLSTMYPVEYTPTLIFASISPSGRLISSPFILQTKTAIFGTPVFPLPVSSISITPPWLFPENSSYPTKPTSTPPTDNVKVDPLYWVQTIIKANHSLVETQPEFECIMQKNLARVYASAFKRHLLNSLGVFDEGKSGRRSGRRRRRRSSSSFKSLLDREELDAEWLYSNEMLTIDRMRTLATTAMNVTVTILNVTQDDPSQQHLNINYVVFAEGTPVLAHSAVQDLKLVSRKEMEEEIGYEVINKAEALVASPLQEANVQTAVSPWLIVAVTTIFLMVLLIVIIIYMVWKWKHNRLGDTILSTARPQSGIEEGVINPAFLGPPSPIERSEVHTDLHRTTLRSSSISVKSSTEVRQKRYSSSETSVHRESQEALASELNALLARQGDKLSPSAVDRASARGPSRQGSSLKQSQVPFKSSQDTSPPHSQKRHHRSQVHHAQKSSGSGSEGRKRKSTEYSTSTESDVDTKQTTYFPGRVKVSNLEEHLPEGLSRSIDKISFGNLDVSQDALARPMSAKAKTLLPKGALPTAEVAKPSQGPFTGQAEETKSIGEQDRDVEESLEGVSSTYNVSEPATKDAQVQTPTRKSRGKPKPKKRTGQLSSDSLVSTESEDTVFVHEFEALPGDANPMGRMRKRFHQFLDDAFNIMGKKEEGLDDSSGRSKSARVSISHQVETREASRPWTSQTVREESLRFSRPKSASLGFPKAAWDKGAGERRCQSAKSQGRGSTMRGRDKKSETTILEKAEESEADESDMVSTSVPLPPAPESSSSNILQQRVSYVDPVFPNYPIYPDVPTSGRSLSDGADRTPRSLHPAVPLILAIKEEIKRFEKIKSTHPPND